MLGFRPLGTGPLGDIPVVITTVGIIGSAGTAAAGVLAIGAASALSGASATGAAGLLGIIIKPGFSGAGATGSAGLLAPSDLPGILGVAATASPGTLALTEAIGPAGVAGTAAAGTFAVTIIFGLTGAGGTSGAGILSSTTSAVANLTGVAATGVAGSFAIAELFGVTGISATGAAGLLSPGLSIFLQGVGAIGFAGTVRVTSVIAAKPGRTLVLFPDQRAVVLSADIRALLLPPDEAMMQMPDLEWSPAAGMDSDFYWLLLAQWLPQGDTVNTPTVTVLPAFPNDPNPLTVVGSPTVDTGPRQVTIPPGVPITDPGPRIQVQMTGGTVGYTYVTAIAWQDSQGRTMNRRASLYIQW